MKRLRFIVRLMVTFLLVGYLGLLALLHIAPLQQRLTEWVAKSMSETLHTEVKIRQVEVGLFNRVVLHDVFVKDQAQRELLRSKSVAAKIQLLPLLKGKISLRTVSLIEADIQLYQSKEGAPHNYQFVLDALKSKEDTATTPLDLRINSLILRRCRLRYDKWYEAKTPEKWNTAHLDFSKVDANLSLKALQKDSVHLRLRSLSLQEQSGVQVKELRFTLAANTKQAVVKDLTLQLSETVVKQDRVTLTYDLAKGLLPTLAVRGRWQGVVLSSQDAVPFFPHLKGWNQTLWLNADYQYAQERLHLANCFLADKGEKIKLHTDVILDFSQKGNRAVKVAQLRLDTEAPFVAQAVEILMKKPLPSQLLALQKIHLTAAGHYYEKGHCHLKAEMVTAVGKTRAEGDWKDGVLHARVDAKDWNLATLTREQHLPTRAHFSGEVKDLDTRKASLSGNVHLRIQEADFRGYRYENVALHLWAKEERCSLTLQSLDPNLTMAARATARLQKEKLSDLVWTAEVQSFSPAALRLTDFLGNSTLSFVAQGQAALPSIKTPTAHLQLSHLKMRKGEQHYDLEDLYLALTSEGKKQRLQLRSDFAVADIEGNLSLPHLQNGLSALSNKLSIHLFPAPKDHFSSSWNDEWRFDVRLLKDDFFQKILQLPLSFTDRVELKGNLRTDDAPMQLTLVGNKVTYNGHELSAPQLSLQGAGSEYRFLAQMQTKVKDTEVKVALHAQTDSGGLKLNLSWDDLAAHRYRGELLALLNAHTTAYGKPHLSLQLDPTHLLIGDTLWSINGGYFDWKDKSLKVEHFSLESGMHRLDVHGGFSPHSNDTLQAVLQKMDVDYILSLVDFDTFRFQGLATGRAFLRLSEGVPEVQADLHIDSLYMNEGLLGHTHLKGGFDGHSQRILLDAAIREGEVAAATVKGYVSPAHKDLDLHILNHRLRANFLQPYLKDIVTELDTRSTGHFRVSGTFKDIALSGVQDFTGKAHVNSLGLDYVVEEGHVEVEPALFTFTNVRITDGEGGTGELSGRVTHDYLRNMVYHFDADVDNLYVFHQPDVPAVSYFGQVYGTGRVSMKGHPGSFSADIHLTPERRSSLTYKLENQEETAVPFLTFRDRDSVALSAIGKKSNAISLPTVLVATPKPTPSSTTDVRLNFYIDANPNADLRVLMNPKGDDYVLLRGTGGLHATYYNKGAFLVYGTYHVQSGSYRMTMQDILSKEFAFTGGQVNFTGDPFRAALDLKASYTVPSASLSGLYSAAALSDNNVRVNCLLNIGGTAESPQVDFDLDLPTADNEVKQLVRSVINTQNDMNMQVLYLLSFGRFYSYNAPTTLVDANASQSMATMKSFLSSTLTSQLNEILSNAMGASNWSFGTNISTGDIGWSDMEVEGVLRGSLLNNRLLINGNLGYRDRALSTRTSTFVGDFDLRYLLTSKGGVSLKAYSATNERYFTRSSLTTQGVGIMLRKDFNSFGDLFRRKKRKRSALQLPSSPN